MGERYIFAFRGFESPKLPKQAKYIYDFATKNHGLYNKKSPIKSDFFAVTSFLHNHYGGDEDDKSETVLSSDNVRLLALSLKLK